MKSKHLGKRCLSLILSLVMVAGMLPIQVFAEEIHVHTEECTVDHGLEELTFAEEPEETEESSATEEETDQGENALVDEFRAELAAYIEKYGLSVDMPDSVLADVYTSLDGQQAMEAYNKLTELEEKATGLSQNEVDTLLSEQNSKLVQRFYNVIQTVNSPEILATTSLNKDINNVTVGVSEATDVTESGGTVTVNIVSTQKSGSGCSTVNAASKTAKITMKPITNLGGTLEFSYIVDGSALASGYPSFSIANKSTETGKYSAAITGKSVDVLEGTRTFTSENIEDIKKAVCYVFADYLCKLAGDYIDIGNNQSS